MSDSIVPTHRRSRAHRVTRQPAAAARPTAVPRQARGSCAMASSRSSRAASAGSVRPAHPTTAACTRPSRCCTRRPTRMRPSAARSAAARPTCAAYWRSDDLTALIRLMLVNRDVMETMEGGAALATAPLRRVLHWLNRNSPDGSRAQHRRALRSRQRPVRADARRDHGVLLRHLRARRRRRCTRRQIAKFERICRKLAALAARITCSRSAPAGAASPSMPRAATAAA